MAEINERMAARVSDPRERAQLLVHAKRHRDHASTTAHGHYCKSRCQQELT